MSEEADYYQILEVEKTATGDEIKKSFRRLAMKYHPDRNPNDKEAEQKFKEINEAYEVLKDEQKRAAYDRYGKQAFAGGMGGTGGNPFGGFEFNFGSGGFSDIFSDVFSEFMGGGSRRQSYAQRGADVRYNMDISLDEAFSGLEKEITLPLSETCATCHGHGTKDGKEAPVCDMCKGSGKVRMQHGGFFVVEQACPKCHGTGHVVKDACPDCKGAGVIHQEKTIKIKIPAGVEDGTRMRIAGAGEAGSRGGENGDLYVFISVKPHKLYTREGADLYTRIPISMCCAALGGKVEIPSIDGAKIELDIAAGSQNDQVVRVKNQGMTMMRSAKRGDMFVKLRVETPVNLTAKQKELLEAFRAESKEETCQPESKSFFDKIKDLFVA